MFSRPTFRPRCFTQKIVTCDDGTYRWRWPGSEEGTPARSLLIQDEFGSPWSIVSWFPENPAEWWLRHEPLIRGWGLPPILGAAEITFASYMDADLLLVETPARWLELATGPDWRGPCACVLDWTRPDALLLWLSLINAVQCEAPCIERALREKLHAKPVRRRLRVELAATPAPTPKPAPRKRVGCGTVFDPFAIGQPMRLGA